MRQAARYAPGFAACSVYAALSALLLWHGADLRRDILGITSDPLLFIWCLAWWPYALLHHLDPLHLHLVWQPEGLDLVWATCIPFLAVLAAPVTLLTGPVVSFNLLTLLAPVSAAGAAYALCLYVTRQPLAAFCGGLAYGFSTYEMAESLAHLNLDFSACVPLMLLVVLARLDDRLGRIAAAAWFALLLAAQFYISTEVSLTALLFGGMGWMLALCIMPARRPVLCRLVADGALAGLFALPLLSPFLYDIAAVKRSVLVPLGWTYMASAHLLNLFVTTPPMALYSHTFPVAGRSWLLGLPQSDISTGLPLLLLAGLYFWRGWRNAAVRLQAACLLCLFLCSLGPQLWLGWRFTGIILPWMLVLHVPLLATALPGRFLLYADLLLALCVASWIANAARPRAAAAFACFAVGLTIMPPHPVMPAPYSSFFRPGQLQAALGQGARVLILPHQGADASGFWQAENDFGFVQTQGYLGMPPAAMLRYPAVAHLIVDPAAPALAAEIAQLAAATHTQYVLAGPDTLPIVLTRMASLPWPRRQVADTIIFTVPVSP